MHAQALADSGHPGPLATKRALALRAQLHQAGLEPLRIADDEEGIYFLLATSPWLEVRVDAEGIATANAVLALGDDLASLATFVRTGHF
jgi:hypothetical protein